MFAPPRLKRYPLFTRLAAITVGMALACILMFWGTVVLEDSVADAELVLDELRANDQPIPENLPPRVRQYLIETDSPPDWTDLQRVARAHEFFLDDGMHVASVLSFGAMVNCYAQPRPSRTGSTADQVTTLSRWRSFRAISGRWAQGQYSDR